MKRLTIITLTAASLLSACTQTSSPPMTLSQKLEGKPPAERQEILRLACLNEAEYTTDIKKAAYQRKYGSKRLASVRDTEEAKKLKSLCREMTAAYLPPEINKAGEEIQNVSPAAGGNTTSKASSLNAKCTALLQELDSTKSRKTTHNMQQICNIMTGSSGS